MEERIATSKVKRQTGTFTFRVEGYGGLSTRVGESCESPEFELCGHIWQLRIFPGGSLEIHRGFLSFYLASKSTRNARASYRLTVCNQVNGVDETFASSGVRIFEAKGVQIDGWGRDKFMTVGNLMNPDKGYYVNDIIIFKTEITVFSDLEHEDTLDNPIAQALKNQTLPKCLKSLFTSESGFPDVRLVFEDTIESLSAHRCILVARSPVFCAMFNSQMKESFSGEIMVHDIDIVAMRELLTYMYTDAFSDDSVLETYAEELLVAATKYDVIGVRHLCELALIDQIEDENVFELLSFADLYGATKLKSSCIHFIGNMKGDIFQSSEFLQLNEDLATECLNTLQQTMRAQSNKTNGAVNTSGEKKTGPTCTFM